MSFNQHIFIKFYRYNLDNRTYEKYKNLTAKQSYQDSIVESK